MKTFALIGAAGYVAPRHMKAIKETNNELVACLDPCDSVGIIDSYFPTADFFTEFERFDRHLDKRKRKGFATDFLSICSPNYLHDSHVRFGLRTGCDVICEKPLVLNPWNIDALQEIEQEYGKKVNTILQLRLHPSVIALQQQIAESTPGKKLDVDLTYITSRGNWYHRSWKGETDKSGGIATNIGVHFFDMLHFLFGQLQDIQLHQSSPSTCAGYLEYEHARVRWFLSIDEHTLPQSIRNSGQRTYRSILMNGEEFEFSGGFTDLHTVSYQHILAGQGFSLEDNRVAINTVATLRNAEIVTSPEFAHPLVGQ